MSRATLADQIAFDTTGEGLVDTWYVDTDENGVSEQLWIDTNGDAVGDTGYWLHTSGVTLWICPEPYWYPPVVSADPISGIYGYLQNAPHTFTPNISGVSMRQGLTSLSNAGLLGIPGTYPG